MLLGYSFFISYPVPSQKNAAPSPLQTQNSGNIVLPKDAVQIQSCADNKGALYARPNNIPNGPVYMVYKGQVIGLEFMLGQAEFAQGKSFADLSGLNAKVDHVNVGYMEMGHEGYPGPHYHVDVYSVDKNMEQSISCPTGSDMMMPMSSSSAMPQSSTSAKAVVSPTGTAMMHTTAPTSAVAVPSSAMAPGMMKQ